MTVHTPTPEQALTGLRAIKTVVTSARPMDPTRRALLAASQQYVLHTNHDLDKLESITPDALAQAILDPQARDQLSRAICLYLMVPDAPLRAELDAAGRFVRALGGPHDALQRMRDMYDKRLIALRFEAMRSALLGDGSHRRRADEGILGALSALGEVLGAHESEVVAARYRGLAEFPKGSLGRVFHAFYGLRGFPFPGEKGGPPESIVAHDLTHVLVDLSTELASEACVTAFQAGYRREGPFTGLLFVLLNLEKGVKATRLASGARHILGEPGMAERIVYAWSCGTKVPMDLVTDWDFWNDMERPLTEVRQRFHIAPLA